MSEIKGLKDTPTDDIKLSKFQFVLVDEKETHIDYPGVKEKGPRPYLVVRSNIFGNIFMACPLTSSKIDKYISDRLKDIGVSSDELRKKAKKYNLVIDYDGVESFIKMGLPIAFKTTQIKEGKIILLDKHLNKSLRKVAIKILKESFDL